MHIASQIMALRRQLDQTHQSYHCGLAELSELARLDEQVSCLLAEARGTHFEHHLICTKAMVRALHTRLEQKTRARELATAV